MHTCPNRHLPQPTSPGVQQRAHTRVHNRAQAALREGSASTLRELLKLLSVQNTFVLFCYIYLLYIFIKSKQYSLK